MRDRSTLSPRLRAMRSTHSSTAESIPRPSRSIFTKPASAQESLSHWQIWRSGERGGNHGHQLHQRAGAHDHAAGVL